MPRFAPELFYEPVDPGVAALAKVDAPAPQSVRNLNHSQLKEWYAPDHRGLGWHQIYTLRGIHYRSYGLDIVHPSRTSVPSLHAGKVVFVTYSSVIGHVIVIKHDKTGVFMTYAHVVNPIAWGTHVEKGQHIAYVAGPSDAHGSAWTGPHVVLHRGMSVGTWIGVNCSNPLKTVNAI